VYIPLGGSRCSKAKIIRNTSVIFLVSGLWHGANWTFIAWGAYHALLFLPLILLGKNRKYRDTVADGRLLPSFKEAGQMLLTFVLVVFGWIIFQAETIGQAWDYFGQMFSISIFSKPMLFTRMYYIPTFTSILILFMVEWFQRKKDFALDLSSIRSAWIRRAIYLFLILSIFWYGGRAESFLYFQF
jgi:D-alanyl-lipoteichoic acid acyltransferase DltB (MBOAT superfamily)